MGFVGVFVVGGSRLINFETIVMTIKSLSGIAKSWGFIVSIDDILELGGYGGNSDFHRCVINCAFEYLACGLTHIVTGLRASFTYAGCHLKSFKN